MFRLFTFITKVWILVNCLSCLFGWLGVEGVLFWLAGWLLLLLLLLGWFPSESVFRVLDIFGVMVCLLPGFGLVVRFVFDWAFDFSWLSLFLVALTFCCTLMAVSSFSLIISVMSCVESIGFDEGVFLVSWSEDGFSFSWSFSGVLSLLLFAMRLLLRGSPWFSLLDFDGMVVLSCHMFSVCINLSVNYVFNFVKMCSKDV